MWVFLLMQDQINMILLESKKISLKYFENIFLKISGRPFAGLINRWEALEAGRGCGGKNDRIIDVGRIIAHRQESCLAQQFSPSKQQLQLTGSLSLKSTLFLQVCLLQLVHLMTLLLMIAQSLCRQLMGPRPLKLGAFTQMGEVRAGMASEGILARLIPPTIAAFTAELVAALMAAPTLAAALAAALVATLTAALVAALMAPPSRGRPQLLNLRLGRLWQPQQPGTLTLTPGTLTFSPTPGTLTPGTLTLMSGKVQSQLESGILKELRRLLGRLSPLDQLPSGSLTGSIRVQALGCLTKFPPLKTPSKKLTNRLARSPIRGIPERRLGRPALNTYLLLPRLRGPFHPTLKGKLPQVPAGGIPYREDPLTLIQLGRPVKLQLQFKPLSQSGEKTLLLQPPQAKLNWWLFPGLSRSLFVLQGEQYPVAKTAAIKTAKIIAFIQTTNYKP